MLKKIICYSTLSLLMLSACSSSMKINSTPEGAKIYIDQEYKGVTPYLYSDERPFWSELNIKLKKDNYQDFDIIIKKIDGEINYKAGCGSLVCLPIWGLPFSLWLFKYPAEKNYELLQVQGQAKKETENK